MKVEVVVLSEISHVQKEHNVVIRTTFPLIYGRWIPMINVYTDTIMIILHTWRDIFLMVGLFEDSMRRMERKRE
jgi:hypothetical protein